jgi:chromosomal replication initiator protein
MASLITSAKDRGIFLKTVSELWKNTLDALEAGLETKDFDTWIDGRLSFVRFNKTNGELMLGVDSDFVKAQLERSYQEMIDAAATAAFGTTVKTLFLLPEEVAKEKENIRIKPSEELSDENIFNPRYTFDNFIVGDNSRFAAGAAQEVAKAPGKTYSPLFIYGGSGLGKTHLMNAIGIYILEHHPDLKVLYVSAETFTEEFVMASISKKMNAFKAKYRNIDVLLIDDIQFISEKEKTVEEVFNTYNTLYSMGKQMVFTSDRPPKDILGLDERLKGRLAAGLLVDILPPSYEIKVAILMKKALLDGVTDDEGVSEIISFISENIRSNVRELESAFNRVVAFAKFTDAPFTKALAKQVLKDVVQMSGNGPSAKDIKKVVAHAFSITVADIDSAERSRSLSMPRQIAMYLCRDLTDLSYPKIAEVFKKDYSTVHHACMKIAKDLKTNSHLSSIVEELTEKIQNEY